MHSVAHGGYMGKFARAFRSQDQVKTGDRVRFRLIEVATNRIFPVAVSGVSGTNMDKQADPFDHFQRGETVRITMVNDTACRHGIHLRGPHFHAVDESWALGDLRETTFVDAGERPDIICAFYNLGRWLIHCHLPSHAVGGIRIGVNVA